MAGRVGSPGHPVGMATVSKQEAGKASSEKAAHLERVEP